MKIIILKNTVPKGFSWMKGKEVDAPDEIAMNLIEDGFAIRSLENVPDPEPEVKETEDVIQKDKQDKPAAKSTRRKRAPKSDS